jgi:hypothetical protein
MADKYPSITAYAYCYNKPIDHIDRFGLWGEKKAERKHARAVKRYGADRVGNVHYNIKNKEYGFRIYDTAEDKNKDGKKTGNQILGIQVWDKGSKVYSNRGMRKYARGEIIRGYYNSYPANIDPKIRHDFSNMRAQYISHNEMNQSLFAHGQKSNTGALIGFGTAAVLTGVDAGFKVATGPLGLIIAAGTTYYTIEKNRIDNEFWGVLQNYYGSDPTTSTNKDGIFITHTSSGASYGGGFTYVHYFNARTGNLLGTVRYNW